MIKFLFLPYFIIFLTISCQFNKNQTIPELSTTTKNEIPQTQLINGILRYTIIDGDPDHQANRGYYTLETEQGHYIDLQASGISPTELNKLQINKPLSLFFKQANFSTINTQLDNGLDVIDALSVEQNIFSQLDLRPDDDDFFDMDIAFVILNFKNKRSPGLNENFIENFKAMLENSTWNKFRFNISQEDVYEYDIDKEYPGCQNWTSLGGTANSYISNNIKKHYDRIVTFIPNIEDDRNSCGWIGITNITSYKEKRSPPIVLRSRHPQVSAHEIGHTLGFGHSGVDDGDGKYTDNDYKFRYQDYSCIMGNGNNVTTMNAPKMLKINVLNPENGLRVVAKGDNILHALSYHPQDHGEASALIHKNYVFSLRSRNKELKGTSGLSKEYLGAISVHLITGKSVGNKPSSILLKLVRPGEIWETPDKEELRMQFIKYDPIHEEAILRFNGDIVDDDDYIRDGCLVYGLERISVSHEKRYFQSPFGYLNLNIAPSFVGKCRSEDFSFSVKSIDSSISIDSEVNNIEQDMTVVDQFNFQVPYSSFQLGDLYDVNVEVLYKNENIYNQDIRVNNQKCNPGSFGCEIQVECQKDPVYFLSVEDDIYKEGKEFKGELVVANNNGSQCEATRFIIEPYFSSNSGWEDSDFTISKKLDTNDHFKNSRLFYLKPLKAIRIPFKGIFTQKNFSKPLVIKLKQDENSKAYNIFINKTNFNQFDLDHHKFGPENINEFHKTGIEVKYDAKAFIEEIMYKQFLNRIVDKESLDYWLGIALQDKMTKLELFSRFMYPAIHEDQYNKMNNRTFVYYMYLRILGRKGEKAGIDYWTDELNKGMDRFQMAKNFVGSEEFHEKNAKYKLR